MKQSDKFRQANKEALATVIATCVVICFWWAAGFGLAACPVQIFATPLWVWTGCVGTWLFACLIVWLLIKFVFQNFDLDDGEANHE